MDFPSISAIETEVTAQLVSGLGKKPIKAMKARDLLALFKNEQEIRDLVPDFSVLAKQSILASLPQPLEKRSISYPDFLPQGPE
jgi:hypothetical protein